MRNRQRRQRRLPLRTLERFLRRLRRACPPPRNGTLTVHLVSDATMRRYQRQFRGIDESTDVLAFPAGFAVFRALEPAVGDIAISVPQAQRQARQLGHSLGRELQLLALHGYLHLLGYDHTRDGGTMRRLERRLVRRLLARRRA